MNRVIVLLVAASMLLLAACGSTPAPAPTPAPAAPAAAAPAAPAAPAAAMVAATAFTAVDNFDALPTGALPAGYTAETDAGATAVVSAEIPGASGANSIKLSDESTAIAPTIFKVFGAALRKGVIGYAVYIPTGAAGDTYMVLQAGADTSAKVFDFQISAKGNVKYRNSAGSLADAGGKLKNDKWFNVELRWDCDAGKVTVVIDNAVIGEFPLINSSVPDRLAFKVGSSTKTGQSAYIDNIAFLAQ